jgi:flagellar hook-associated protein 2
MKTFTDDFNQLVDGIGVLTKWDSSTNKGGLLLGDSTILSIQQQMYTVFNNVVPGAGRYSRISDVGMTLTDGAKITFDADKFSAAYATDTIGVQNLFTQKNTGLGALMDQGMTQLVDPIDGSVILQNKSLDTQMKTFNDQITSMDSLLADKKNRLEQQFANMETVLAGLQSQQSALSSLTGITTTATKTA